MEEILFLRSISPILNMILPIVVIIAVVMIVSRLGGIRNDLEQIKIDISNLRYLKERQDIYESFDRDLPISEEEETEAIAKKKLYVHMLDEPIYSDEETWQNIALWSIFLYFLYWLFADAGSKTWIGWIVILPVAAGLYYIGIEIGRKKKKKFQRKFKRWEHKLEKLQKILINLRKYGDSSIPEEEKAEAIAKNELFEHMLNEPELGSSDAWYGVLGSLGLISFLCLLYWFLIPESYTGFWSWGGWIVIFLVAAFLALGAFLTEPENNKKRKDQFEKKFKLWEQKREKLQKNLNDLRK